MVRSIFQYKGIGDDYKKHCFLELVSNPFGNEQSIKYLQLETSFNTILDIPTMTKKRLFMRLYHVCFNILSSQKKLNHKKMGQYMHMNMIW